VDSLVDELSSTLGALGLDDLLQGVIDAVADALVSNTLTLLQSTDVTTTLTEYDFEGLDTVSGNVLTGDGDGNVGDSIAEGGIVTRVSNSEGESVTVPGEGAITLTGLYGALTIAEDGSYSYTATGARAALGQSEAFTYEISDGTGTATATLAIDIEGEGTAGDIAIAGVAFEYATEPGLDIDGAVSDSWLIGIDSRTETSDPFTVEAGTTQDLTMDVTMGNVLGLGGSTTLSVQRLTAGEWPTIESFDSDQLIGLLGLGGNAPLVLAGRAA